MIYQDKWLVQSPILAKSITKECLVKIETIEEKFNVDIVYVKKNGDIVGRVCNFIIHEKPYKTGDLVMFQKKHAIEISTLEERKDRAHRLIPDLKDMLKIYILDYMKIHGRYPDKAETEEYFERHVNIL